MGVPQLSLDMTVGDALARWPELSAVFFRHRMACPGCAMAPFERLADVARSYGLSADRLLRELRATLREVRR
jgi:hybrid cluster-associated redox disulfide protein